MAEPLPVLGTPYSSLRRSPVDPVTGNIVMGPLGRPSPLELAGAFVDLQAGRVRDAVTAPQRAYSGKLQVFDPETGHTTEAAREAAGGLAGLAMTGGLGGAAVRQGETALGAGPIRAYHTSPYDVDRFDLKFLGGGEGTNFEGRGIYTTNDPGVRDWYKEFLDPRPTLDGKPLVGLPDTHPARTAWNATNFYGPGGEAAGQRELWQSVEGLLSKADPKTGRIYDVPWRDAAAREELKTNVDAIELMRNGRFGVVSSPRRYDVDIHADPERFVNLEAGLADQSAPVRKAFADLGWDGRTGQGAVNGLYEARGAEAANAALLDRGVVGTRSRPEEGVTRPDAANYLVFDPGMIEILRKYGLAGAAPLGAGASALGTPTDVQAAPLGR